MKQAVVLIHGIGEQKPMDTVRSFVEAVLPPAEAGKEQYWSKPDPMSESFELRRLQAVGRNKVHSYEYYWASQIDGTTFRHLGQWLLQLVFRRPSNVPHGLRTVWGLSWILLIGAGLAAGLGWFGRLIDVTRSTPYAPISLLLFALLAVVQGALIYYAGDAARYLSPSPQNIAVRQRIRSEGVKLLRRLQRSGDYDRIVVVGHSLGSVIGYDILTALWRSNNEVNDFEKKGADLDKLLASNSRPQPVVRDAIASLGEALRHIPVDSSTLALRTSLQRAFRSAQLACWREQRAWGNPWLITDLITMGSPLAHAMMLLARNNEEFKARKQQRELPTCPPVTDGKRYAYSPDETIKTPAGRQFSPLVLHHAACFAPTRWTNFYFPAYFGLFGDVVGGPLADAMGPGITDVAVTSSSLRRFTLAAHTTYWNPQSAAPDHAAGPRPFALPALMQALRLEHTGDYVVPESASNDSLHTAMLELTAKIDDAYLSPTASTDWLGEVLSDRFVFHRAGDPVRGKDGFLESLSGRSFPASHATKSVSVTSIGRDVLVITIIEGTLSDRTKELTRHLRVFAQTDNKWSLETWHCYPLSK